MFLCKRPYTASLPHPGAIRWLNWADITLSNTGGTQHTCSPSWFSTSLEGEFCSIIWLWIGCLPRHKFVDRIHLFQSKRYHPGNSKQAFRTSDFQSEFYPTDTCLHRQSLWAPFFRYHCQISCRFCFSICAISTRSVSIPAGCTIGPQWLQVKSWLKFPGTYLVSRVSSFVGSGLLDFPMIKLVSRIWLLELFFPYITRRWVCDPHHGHRSAAAHNLIFRHGCCCNGPTAEIAALLFSLLFSFVLTL